MAPTVGYPELDDWVKDTVLIDDFLLQQFFYLSYSPYIGQIYQNPESLVSTL